MKKILPRLVSDLALFIFVIHGWWILVLILAMIANWKFPYFWEILLAGLAYDSLFNFSSDPSLSSWLGTILAAVIFVLIVFAKRVVRR